MWQAVPALAKARSPGTSFKKISWQEYAIFTIKYGKLWAVHPKSYGESSYTADFPRGLPLEVGKDMPVGYGHLGAHPSPHPWNTATLHTCSVHATLGLPVVGTCYEIVTCYCHGARFSPNSVKTALQQVKTPQGSSPRTPLLKWIGLKGALCCYSYFRYLSIQFESLITSLCDRCIASFFPVVSLQSELIHVKSSWEQMGRILCPVNWLYFYFLLFSVLSFYR